MNYSLVEQILIDMYQRQGETWTNKMYTATDAILLLPILGIEIAIADKYEWVDFEKKSSFRSLSGVAVRKGYFYEK